MIETLTKRITNVLAWGVLILFISCKPSTAPQEHGSLSGTVILLDTLGQLLPSSADVMVQVEGTSLLTRTDIVGRWTIEGVPTGTHVISISKAGFGGERIMNIVVAGPGLQDLGTAHLTSPISDTAFISEVKLDTTKERTIQPEFRITVFSRHPTVPLCTTVLFISPDSSFNQSDPLCYTTSDNWSGPYQILFKVPIDNIRQLGIPSGTKLYFASAFMGAPYLQELHGVTNIWTVSSYLDINLHHNLYTACGPRGNVMSFIMP